MSVKILMVCLGNICRSPLAEGILASKLPTEKFFVDSAGTGSWHVGHAPDKRSIATAEKNGLNIANQKGRQFSKADFDTFDYIFVMDNSNYNDGTRNMNNPSSNMGDSLPFSASNKGSGSAQFPSSSYSVGAGMTSAPSSQNSTTRPPLPPAQTSTATSTATATSTTAAVSKEPVGTAAAPGMVGKVIDCHLSLLKLQ